MSDHGKEQAHRDLCPKCAALIDLEQVIEGDEFRPLGMVSASPGSGVLCFAHEAEGCGQTIAIPLNRFSHLIDGPVPSEILHGSDVCEGHCLTMADLEQCSQDCGHAAYRKLMVDWVALWNEEHGG